MATGMNCWMMWALVSRWRVTRLVWNSERPAASAKGRSLGVMGQQGLTGFVGHLLGGFAFLAQCTKTGPGLLIFGA